MTGLRHNRPFRRFWLASTVSDFGSHLTTLAISVIVLVTLEGSPLDQGLVNASRWTPYLLFGLLAGIWVDRFRRRLVLVVGDIGRGLVLAALCVLAVTGVLAVPTLVVFMFVFGFLALMSDAAYQSFVPQLVPRSSLVRANFRLQQSETVAQISGSAVAGALIAIVTAPFALLIDALTYFFSGFVLLSLRQTESNRVPARAETSTGQRIVEGLRWVYQHPRLWPLAVGTPIWFIGSAVLGTVFPALVLLELDLGPLGLGVILGCAGIGSVIGLALSMRLDTRFGTGRVMVFMRLVQPVAVALVALSPTIAALPAGGTATAGAYATTADWPIELWAGVVAAALGQFVFGLAMGAEGPLEISYRQAVTPDRLLARMSATMRSVNRGMIVVGALLGGAIASMWSVAAALWIASAFMVAAGLVLAFSKFRTARIDHDVLPDEDAALKH